MRTRTQFSLLALVTATLILSCASTDTGITTKVKARLAEDETVRLGQIEVQTRNGVVTLTGNVDSDASKSRALELARGTKGVVSVVDMLAAKKPSGAGNAPEPPRTIGERADDAEITMSVKSRLLDDPDVKGLKIDVDTREGVVYLTGTVRSNAERDKAVQLAREAKGVRDVQANLTIQGG